MQGIPRTQDSLNIEKSGQSLHQHATWLATAWVQQMGIASSMSMRTSCRQECGVVRKRCISGVLLRFYVAAGDAFLCVTGAAKIKVYDRDGKERGESVLGDPYIRDTKNTKGHQSPCTSGHWHPTDRRALPAWLQRARTVTAYAPGIAGALAWCACLHGCRGRAPLQLLASDCRALAWCACMQCVYCCAAVHALCCQTPTM